MYLPAFGVISAYTLADGTLSPEFYQAIGVYDVSPPHARRRHHHPAAAAADLPTPPIVTLPS